MMVTNNTNADTMEKKKSQTQDVSYMADLLVFTGVPTGRTRNVI